jgi:hypothetical protein
MFDAGEVFDTLHTRIETAQVLTETAPSVIASCLMTTSPPYVRQVADNVRAELGRTGLLQKQLAIKLGKSDEWVSRRIRRVDPQPMTTADVALFAAALDVSPSVLTANHEADS